MNLPRLWTTSQELDPFRVMGAKWKMYFALSTRNHLKVIGSKQLLL
jgi:hypothetical protein